MKWKQAKLIVFNRRARTYHVENHYRSEDSKNFVRIYDFECGELIEKGLPYGIEVFELIDRGHVVLVTEV